MAEKTAADYIDERAAEDEKLSREQREILANFRARQAIGATRSG